MSIATTGISDLLTAQDQPVSRGGRAGGEAFSSILGGFSVGPVNAVSLPTTIVGNPTPTPAGLQEAKPTLPEGETDFIMGFALPGMIDADGGEADAPVPSSEAAAPKAVVPEIAVPETDVFKTGDPDTVVGDLPLPAMPSPPANVGRKAEWALGEKPVVAAFAANKPAKMNVADAAVSAVTEVLETDSKTDGLTPDAEQAVQDQQALAMGQTLPAAQMQAAAAVTPTEVKNPGAAATAPIVEEAAPSVSNPLVSSDKAPVPASLNAEGYVPTAVDASVDVPDASTALAETMTDVSAAPAMPDVPSAVPSDTDKAKGKTAASKGDPLPVLEDMAMPVQEVVEKISAAAARGKGRDSVQPDNQESASQTLPDGAGRNNAPGQMQAAQHSLAQQLAGTAPAGVPFGHVVREAVHSAHQAMIEDLMIGNSVEDQWVDRLAQDVETLVSSDNREARLHLRPRELGDLSIRLEMQDGKARVHFTVDTAAAQSLIADAAPRLQAMMENRGFRLEQSSVDVGSGGSSAGHQGSGGNGRQDSQPFAKVPPSELAGIARRVARQTGFERYA